MANPPILSYNRKNLILVGQLIKKHLTIDLLNKEYWETNKKNKMFGHCHNASGCLYKIFGANHIHMYRAKDGKFNGKDFYHWWVQDNVSGKVIDLTARQYKSKEKLSKLYKKGEKAGLLGFGYKKRVQYLLDKVMQELKSHE
jgi:hypothetical protein